MKYADNNETWEKVDDIRKNGLPPGISTGIPGMDKHLKILKGQLNVVSGFPSSGKSELVENIACNMAKTHGWNIVEYVPETYPNERHFMSLIEKTMGKPIKNRSGRVAMTEDEYFGAQFDINERFQVISADEDPYTFEEIITEIDTRCKDGDKIDMLIIDPWNEMESGRPSNMSETDYIGKSLMIARRLARRHKISFWIIPHPAKPPQKNKEGKYDPPDLYDLAGSAHWRNKTDNGIIVHRETLEGTLAHVMVKKVKNRFYGTPGEVVLDFDWATGRFRSVDGWVY